MRESFQFRVAFKGGINSLGIPIIKFDDLPAERVFSQNFIAEPAKRCQARILIPQHLDCRTGARAVGVARRAGWTGKSNFNS